MKKDPQFGRTDALEPLETPPFYASTVTPWYANAVDGLKINTKGQVLDVFDRVIPRLYAAGRDALCRGMMYPGCGTSVATNCVIFGRIAGKNAAAEKPWT